MHFLQPPEDLSPHERLDELASILAWALVQLQARAALPWPENFQNPVQIPLEVVPNTVLSGHTG